jgi:hypothetical protein
MKSNVFVITLVAVMAWGQTRANHTDSAKAAAPVQTLATAAAH